jgi:thioredoxin reductase
MVIESNCDVAIIGAGPYGLSAAAHLRRAGVDARVFGQPMEFWEHQMPAGMRLRSPWHASHISDPAGAFTLDRYERERGAAIDRPIPLRDFIGYARWFQRSIVPDLDPRKVTVIRTNGGRFRLTLEDRQVIETRRVVIAAGIARFAFRPKEFGCVPRGLATHSCEHRDFARLAGRSVIVVGAGQSAVESAALLNEAGARVELIARTPAINWLTRSSQLHRLPGFVRALLYHRTDVGPALVSQLVARPHLFRLLPRRAQDRLAQRSIRPAASGWLRPMVEGVRFTMGRRIAGASHDRDRVRIALDDGSIREADHVLLATGYRVDIARYCFMPAELLRAIRRADGYPVLSTGLKSSVAGIYFVGAPAAYSFGPLVRFVSGTAFASASLTESILNSFAKGE